ncbi:DUF4190 domain-containing protein [Kitasatospora sp. LaBMicrA B282]|uniref:DUF4190 domain-containing protein n=1 Tax=Kitasatospora sp. LaBMicrA B282 TaxID=3420949 RepID=UPI003D0AA727
MADTADTAEQAETVDAAEVTDAVVADAAPEPPAPEAAPEPAAHEPTAPADATPPPVDPWAAPAPDAPDLPPRPTTPPTGPWVHPGQAGPYADPYAQFPYGPQQLPGTNGLAITSLVTGILCCLWPAAIAFGIAALVRLRKRPQRGRGLAITGMVLGVLGLFATVLAAFGLVIGATVLRDETYSLKSGQCFVEDTTAGGAVRRRSVDCGLPHYGEVMATFPVGGATFPGAQAVSSEADDLCHHEELLYVTDPWARTASLGVRYVYPDTQTRWDASGHTVLCFLHDNGKPNGAVGSLRRDQTDLTQAQQSFLKAVSLLDQADALQPTGDPADDSAKSMRWIQQTATAMQQAQTSLSQQNWGSAQSQVSALITELKDDQPHWQNAADDSTTGVDSLVNDLTGRSSDPLEATARQALGLAAQDPYGDSTTAPGGSADAGSGGAAGAAT